MKRKTVSLCMIARDEEATIGLAVKSVLALVDEVIVIDTGSQDNTRIIAEGYGARIVDLRWQDDFAAARNVALSEATCDWILVLDADEKLQPIRPVEFQRMINDEEAGGFRVSVVSPARDKPTETVSQIRLFRNSPAIRYRYPIFEQIEPALSVWCRAQGRIVRDSGISILHENGFASSSAGKRDRNLRILKKAIVNYPDEPYFEYRMARESLACLDDEVLPVAGLGIARTNLEKAWRKVMTLSDAERCALGYGPELVAGICGCLLAANRVNEARDIAANGRSIYGDHPALLLRSVSAGIGYLRQYADDQAPEETARLLAGLRHDIDLLRDEQETVSSTVVDERSRKLYSLRYLGELSLLEGHVGDAAEFFEKALTVDNKYSFAWLGLAECARYAGDRKRALKLYLRTVTENELNHRAWLRGCTLLEELEFHDNAHSWRRKVALCFPEHPQAVSTNAETRQREAPLPG